MIRATRPIAIGMRAFLLFPMMMSAILVPPPLLTSRPPMMAPRPITTPETDS